MNSDSSEPEESQLEVLATFYSEFMDLRVSREVMYFHHLI